jgi:alanine racemase
MAVKANAYGHGAVPVSKTALKEGVSFLGVATVEEGAELRAAGINTPLLLLGLPFPEEAPAIVEHRISPFLGDSTTVHALAAEAKKQGTRIAVHLKVDTGMGRVGCLPSEAYGLAKLISDSGSLYLEGIATHFPVSDSTTGDAFTQEQVRQLHTVLQRLEKKGMHPSYIHAANSGAIIDKPYSLFNLVRPGIILYGYYPSEQQERPIQATPVMEFSTKIVFVKKVPAGFGISYGLTHTTPKETYIATLPVGYGDGYSRLLSNKASVLVGGKRCPVVGRVCMDQTMIDLGPATTAKAGDKAILFGPGNGAPDAAEIATLMGTIPYEVTCLITSRVPRIYVDS